MLCAILSADDLVFLARTIKYLRSLIDAFTAFVIVHSNRIQQIKLRQWCFTDAIATPNLLLALRSSVVPVEDNAICSQVREIFASGFPNMFSIRFILFTNNNLLYEPLFQIALCLKLRDIVLSKGLHRCRFLQGMRRCASSITIDNFVARVSRCMLAQIYTNI